MWVVRAGENQWVGVVRCNEKIVVELGRYTKPADALSAPHLIIHTNRRTGLSCALKTTLAHHDNDMHVQDASAFTASRSRQPPASSQAQSASPGRPTSSAPAAPPSSPDGDG